MLSSIKILIHIYKYTQVKWKQNVVMHFFFHFLVHDNWQMLGMHMLEWVLETDKSG